MTISNPFPAPLEAAFHHTDSEALLMAVLAAVCEVFQCDRCFLHLRDPETRLYQNLCHRRNPNVPDVSTDGWQPEDCWEEEDPMFAAALQTRPSIFVEDIETADPSVLNVEFERQYLGHRALIHAHICDQGKLWAILQPCQFHEPHPWSESDRALMLRLCDRLTPIVIDYVHNVQKIGG